MAITPSNYTFAQEITGQVVGSTIGASVLVITESCVDASLWSHVANGGGDIRVATDDTGATQLPLHVALCNTSTSKLVMYVRLPSYAATATSRAVTIFSKNGTDSQPAVTDTYGRNAVYQDAAHVYFAETGYTDLTGNADLSEQGSAPPSVVTLSNGASAWRFSAGDSTALVATSGTAFSLPLTVGFRGAAGEITTNENYGASISTLTGTGGYDITAGIYNSSTQTEGRGRYPQNVGINPGYTNTGNGPVGTLSTGYLIWSASDLSVFNNVAGIVADEQYSVGSASLISNGQPYNKIGIGAAIDTSPIYSTIDVAEAWFWRDARSAEYLALTDSNYSSPGTFWTQGTAYDPSAGGGVSATITESLEPFSDSISVAVSANISAAITETLEPFSDSITASITGTVSAAITESLQPFSDSISADISANISITLTEELQPFADSISATVTPSVGISAAITETLQPFDDSIAANVSANIAAIITEQLQPFADSIGVNLSANIELTITETLDAFSDSISVQMPQVVISSKNTVRIKPRNNTIRVQSRNKTMRVR